MCGINTGNLDAVLTDGDCKRSCVQLCKADGFCGMRGSGGFVGRNNTLPTAITHATVALAVKHYCEEWNASRDGT